MTPPEPPNRRSSLRRWLRRAAIALAVVVALVLLVAAGALLWVRSQLVASLPALDGELEVAGLSAPVTLERDALGVLSVAGESRADVAYGLGFAHAQDRLLQMDLIRRQAAGELAELFGPRMAAVDRRLRVHRFRARAAEVLAALGAEQRELLEAYARGVNAGIGDLGAPPPEYLVLRVEPAAWSAEDSVLVLYSLFVMLQRGSQEYEAGLADLADCLPPDTFRFLTPLGTPWDTPLEGAPPPPPVLPASLAGVPGEEDGAAAPGREADDAPPAASNAWAVAGEHTAHGGALLAVDMHLGYTLPNIWYRAQLEWSAPRAGRLVGITLPGLPLLVAGSNGSIAWGFTSARTDAVDVVLVEPDPQDGERYLTPDGSEPYEVFAETIRGPGGELESLDVRWTRWGPVVEDADGETAALRWTAHDVEAVNLELARLETATSAAEALDVGRDAGLPSLNLLVADAEGHIGWTLIGRVPRREGAAGRLPVSWSAGEGGWQGYLEPSAVPALLDPPSGRLWSANQRPLPVGEADALGDGNYMLGARARQIRDRLFELAAADEAEMLALQLDDRALFLERWRGLLLSVLDSEAVEGDAQRAELRRLAEEWSGRAGVDAVGYTLVRDFREAVGDRLFDALAGGCALDEGYDYLDDYGQSEGPLWALVEARPAALAGEGGWDELLLAAADRVIAAVEERGETLAEQRWGARNRLRMGHMFGRMAPPALRAHLDMEVSEQPGDFFMPRVQSPGYGPSQRMVVSPGREADALFHMPGGQSGHPLSDFYRAGHDDWAEGRPTPLLPGETEHRLRLIPQR